MPLSIRGSTAIAQQASATTFSVQRIRRPAASPVLDAAVSLTSLIAQVATLAPIPAVSAAATALISVLDAYTRVQAHRDRCLRLAQRAVSVLCELEGTMEDKWDDAPQELLDSIAKFELMLLSMRDTMEQIAGASFARRLLSGSKFSELLDDHERRLQDTQVSFQLTSMVAVRYALHLQSAQLSDIRQVVLSTQNNYVSVSKDALGISSI
ncbi:hypothetical protein FA95DRAFT_1609257 [Auriscalpium vulgare]|uniref:Uncharacterized protein n=1 Tax=Auriscalpium vulgare TaxID=40419 RepID=A0ACB8RI56_9AGAM|nr:hypothetical protein FA95DRAFT_1609257 [Auriscalpium vulgare]